MGTTLWIGTQFGRDAKKQWVLRLSNNCREARPPLSHCSVGKKILEASVSSFRHSAWAHHSTYRLVEKYELRRF